MEQHQFREEQGAEHQEEAAKRLRAFQGHAVEEAGTSKPNSGYDGYSICGRY